jgi:hypothetical protein
MALAVEQEPHSESKHRRLDRDDDLERTHESIVAMRSSGIRPSTLLGPLCRLSRALRFSLGRRKLILAPAEPGLGQQQAGHPTHEEPRDDSGGQPEDVVLIAADELIDDEDRHEADDGPDRRAQRAAMEAVGMPGANHEILLHRHDLQVRI